MEMKNSGLTFSRRVIRFIEVFLKGVCLVSSEKKKPPPFVVVCVYTYVLVLA